MLVLLPPPTSLLLLLTRRRAVQPGQRPSFVVFRYILHAKKTAFVVEHDFIMATYLADRVIVFDGIPSKSTAANT